MSYTGQFSADRFWRILLTQGAVGMVAAALAFHVGGGAGVVAALYGTAVAMVNTLLLVWRMHNPRPAAADDAYRQLRGFYRSSAERLAATVVLLAAGFGPLKLAAGALLGGFIVGYLGFLVSVLFGNQARKQA
jgi:F0F1-type ATP synthase assembly protein I